MQLKFIKKSRTEWVPEEGNLIAYLKVDNWDDYNYQTLYSLTVFDKSGIKYELGGVKIGYFGQEASTRTEIPPAFNQLDRKYFSLGQRVEYYQFIQSLNPSIKKLILEGLNDVVHDEALLARALEEDVTKTSLLRMVDLSSIKGQFKRILTGGALLTEYNFNYAIPQSHNTAGLSLDFSVDPESNPPTNIHVLIGRNGVGKTHLLNNMVKALVADNDLEQSKAVGEFSVPPEEKGMENCDDIFAGVVSIAFSAFDPFEPYREEKDKTQNIRYSYVGLKRTTNQGGKKCKPMSPEMLTKEFVNSLMSCVSLGKADRWINAITNLESDQLFKEISLSYIVSNTNDGDLEKTVTSLFNKMSSGHRIVLLTITKLVEKVEEKTLVLIDEPEGHLHPPLLSAFIRSLSDLLSYRNGIAIIATHSPVILQEVPKSCVWKIRRTGKEANADRPENETFGENVGVLTREIFGLEVTDSGYHQLLNNALKENLSYERTLRLFGGDLGSEAKAILRGLIAERDKGEQ